MSKTQEFKERDRVEFTENYGPLVKKGDQGTAIAVYPATSGYAERHGASQLVHVKMDAGSVRVAFNSRMKPLVEAVEQEPKAQPVVIRIAVNNIIGSTEYPTVEAALEAAKAHGNNGDEFALFEVVKIADYRVEVSKTLVEKR